MNLKRAAETKGEGGYREDKEAKGGMRQAEGSLLRLKLREFSVTPSRFKMTLEPNPKMNPT